MARPNPQREVMWNTDFEPLTPMFWRHMACIQVGGRWKKPNGEFAGMGNFYHYKEAQKILWPEKEWHRWNDLLLEKFLEHRIIGVLGPASSGKTYEAATFALIFYYSHSDCATVLVSSTEREMLEMRVWGEMKKAHKLATSRMHGLPGILVESRQRLITDDRAIDSEGRDFRNGVTGIPCKKGGQFVGMGCFPAETLIDTPYGPEPIQYIKVGDRVKNANGVGVVRKTMVRGASTLVRVYCRGRHFDCTPEHPILTTIGWVNAIDLTPQHLLVSTHEAVQILRSEINRRQNTQGILLKEMQMEGAIQTTLLPCLRERISEANTWEKEVLLKSMPTETMGEELQAMREKISANRSKGDFLQQVLFSELESEPTGDFSKNACWSRQDKGRQEDQPIFKEEQETYRCIEEEDAREEPQNTSRENHTQDVPRGQLQHHNCACSARPDMAGYQVGSGNRRGTSPLWEASRPGQIEGFGSGVFRVEGIKVFKPSSRKSETSSERDYRVYNLEVEGHPSYSVNGILVHNSYVGIKNKHIILVADEGAFMPRAYVDAISNLNKNKGFKCIVLGNPKETTDALGVICEPSAELGGWDGGIDQTPKTKTWPTRFKDGICVQLVGSDCPNMDVPKDAPVPYPFLITREAIESDVAFYGMDSIQYSMMNEGRMPRGQGLRRVITRAMCLKFGAMEAPIWKSDERTRIGFMDAAYGSVGGDRCVFGELQIGKDTNDREILAVIETMLVPVTTTNPELPEDQIALFVKAQCEQRHIKPENFFFDSTGRGTLVGAFARLWSANVGLVEFGGKPSERYVSDNIRVLCKDYYSKFVTELWYSVALTIQSGQFRGMTEDILAEGSMREWGFVGANKIEVEPKDKMKLKCGRSPDLFDALVAGVEGARRRGFHIAKLTNVGETADNGWRLDLAKRMERLKKRHTLNYVS